MLALWSWLRGRQSGSEKRNGGWVGLALENQVGLEDWDNVQESGFREW